MNKKLIGGIVVLGGISVIAYYFLFSKKTEKDLLKKFEEKKKTDDELAKIDVDLKLTDKSSVIDTKSFSPLFSALNQKELSEIKAVTDAISAPAVSINPIDFSQLDFELMGSESFQQYVNQLYKEGEIKSGKTPALATW
jgi:hypothetical protein